jgi:hypothetical protein
MCDILEDCGVGWNGDRGCVVDLPNFPEGNMGSAGVMQVNYVAP